MPCSDSFPVLVDAFASLVAQELTDDEIALLSSIFSQIGVSLALILTTRSLRSCDSSTQPSNARTITTP